MQRRAIVHSRIAPSHALTRTLARTPAPTHTHTLCSQVLDMEHAPNEVPDILAQLQAIGASRANVEPVVRTHSESTDICMRADMFMHSSP